MGIGRIKSYFKNKIVKTRDFFNVVKRNDSQMLSIVGDVAGKGIPAALYAAHIQSMFESLSQQSASPANILNGLNQLFDQSRLESALKESAHFPAEKIVERINLRLGEFIKTEESHDDATMLAIKVK